jgi:hypothetical protein
MRINLHSLIKLHSLTYNNIKTNYKSEKWRAILAQPCRDRKYGSGTEISLSELIQKNSFLLCCVTSMTSVILDEWDKNMTMNDKQYKLFFSNHTLHLYPGKMKLLICDSYTATENSLPFAEFRNISLLELQQSIWPAREDVRKKLLCHVIRHHSAERGSWAKAGMSGGRVAARKLSSVSQSESESLYDWQSVCLGVEPRLGLMTRYLFSLKVTVLSIWGALSDERSGLSFVSHSR